MSRVLPVGEQFELAFHPGNILSTALETHQFGGSSGGGGGERLVCGRPPFPYSNPFPSAYHRPLYAARKRAAAEVAAAANPRLLHSYPPSAKSSAPAPAQAAKPLSSQGDWATKRRREALKLVFPYLERRWLVRGAALVCREWAELVESCEAAWESLELGGKELSLAGARAIARRRPKRLNLSWSSVGAEVGRAAVAGNDRLVALSLAGCSSSALGALEVLGPEQSLEELDLRWVSGLDDAILAGLAESWPGLRLSQSLSLSASQIRDASVRLIAEGFPNLRRLDLSHCQLSDAGVAELAVCEPLRELNLASCTALSSAIFEPLARLANLVCVDLRGCGNIPQAASAQFKEAARAAGRCVSVLLS